MLDGFRTKLMIEARTCKCTLGRFLQDAGFWSCKSKGKIEIESIQNFPQTFVSSILLAGTFSGNALPCIDLSVSPMARPALRCAILSKTS